MANFDIKRTVVPDWRGETHPAKPMADQIGDVLDTFDKQKDTRSIGALTQGLRWIDQAHTPDDTIDPKEWQAVSRAMRKALGDGVAVAGRAERIERAFAEEAAAAAKGA